MLSNPSQYKTFPHRPTQLHTALHHLSPHYTAPHCPTQRYSAHTAAYRPTQPRTTSRHTTPPHTAPHNATAPTLPHTSLHRLTLPTFCIKLSIKQFIHPNPSIRLYGSGYGQCPCICFFSTFYRIFSRTTYHHC